MARTPLRWLFLGLALILASGSTPPHPALTQIGTLLGSPDGERGLWGVYVADARTGNVLYAHEAHRPMMPASNQKLVTSALALDVLGSEFRYETHLRFNGSIENGVLRGDLLLVGSGDPSFGSSEISASDPLRTWAGLLAQRGITRVEGRILGDDLVFDRQPYAEGWDVDYIVSQSSRLLGVAGSGLSYGDNLVRVSVRGTRPGQLAQIVDQPSGYLQITNRVTTQGRARGHAVQRFRSLGSEHYRLSGSVAARTPTQLELPVSDPTLFTVHAFAEALREAGILVEAAMGSVRDLETPLSSSGFETLATYTSPTLRTLLRVVNKQSNNFYADQIYRSIAWGGSTAGGEARVQGLMQRLGVQTNWISVRDGSGLSRKNLITAETLGRLLLFMDQHPERSTFLESLAQPGEARSTLRFRLGEANVQAKTGSLEYVRSLSGYVTTASGQRVVFAVLANQYTLPPYRVTQMIDEMVNTLAQAERF